MKQKRHKNSQVIWCESPTGKLSSSAFTGGRCVCTGLLMCKYGRHTRQHGREVSVFEWIAPTTVLGEFFAVVGVYGWLGSRLMSTHSRDLSARPVRSAIACNSIPRLRTLRWSNLRDLWPLLSNGIKIFRVAFCSLLKFVNVNLRVSPLCEPLINIFNKRNFTTGGGIDLFVVVRKGKTRVFSIDYKVQFSSNCLLFNFRLL